MFSPLFFFFFFFFLGSVQFDMDLWGSYTIVGLEMHAWKGLMPHCLITISSIRLALRLLSGRIAVKNMSGIEVC